MTWAEVASDAVKIGLGALIGGAFGLYGMIKTHRLQLNAEYARRRRDGLERVATEFDKVAISGMNQAAAYVAYSETLLEEEVSDEVIKAFAEDLVRNKPLGKCLEELHTLEAKTALLGYPEIAEELETYRHALTTLNLKEAASLQNVTDMTDKIRFQRTLIFTMLAKGYREA
jgi:hypothetical protein